jgi:hypothetical protein
MVRVRISVQPLAHRLLPHVEPARHPAAGGRARSANQSPARLQYIVCQLRKYLLFGESTWVLNCLLQPGEPLLLGQGIHANARVSRVRDPVASLPFGDV